MATSVETRTGLPIKEEESSMTDRTPRTTRVWPIRLNARVIAPAVAAVLALSSVLGAVAFQLSPADPSPATGGARVVAQGVWEVPAEDLIWDVSLLKAETPANADLTKGEVGFILADGGTILYEEPADCCTVRLAAGEAVFTTPDEEYLVAALGPTSVEYYDFRLAKAGSPAGGTSIHQSATFTGSGERHDMDLVSASLVSGESLVLPAGAAPTVLLVITGGAEVSTAEGEFISVEPGAAFSAAGELFITATSDATDLVAAVVGPKVPKLSEMAAQTTADATPVAVSGQPADDGPDTDGDGLSDAKEEEIYTDSILSDTDGDGISDGDEVRLGTNPLIDDSDGDGVDDGDEVAAGTDPRGNAGSAAAPTAVPVEATVAPEEPVTEEPTVAPEEPVTEEPTVAPEPPVEEPTAEPVPEVLDSDSDGIDDAYEVEIGTDPYNYDSDADGLGDGDEMYAYSTGVLNPDSDGDGWLDGDEINLGTDPNDGTSYPVS